MNGGGEGSQNLCTKRKRFGEEFLISPEPLPNTKGHPCGCASYGTIARTSSPCYRWESLSPAGSVRVGSDCHWQSFTTDPFDSLTDTKRKKDHKENLKVRTGSQNLCTKRKRFGEEFLISPEPLPNTKGHPCGCPFVFGGGEGSRTPVRKPLDTTFSGCRTSIESFSSPRRCSGSGEKQPLSA